MGLCALHRKICFCVLSWGFKVESTKASSQTKELKTMDCGRLEPDV